MKIALVSPYDFAYPGGVVNHVANLEKQFTAMGHEVAIIAPASKPVTKYGERFIKMGKPRPIPTSGSIARINISPTLSNRVQEVLMAEKFDVIHLHEPLVPMLCTNILRFSDTVNIGTFHASDSKPSYTWTKPFLKPFLKKWFYRLHGKIAVSQTARNYAWKHFKADYDIIPNGIDTEHFHPEVEPIEELCDGMRNILFVGRMEKRKGVKYLLEAYRYIKEEMQDTRLIIVGPHTRQGGKYIRNAQRDGLKDVIFTGQVSYNDLPRYYRTADIYCAPATGQESFGIVLLEAMAVGTPVVASKINGYSCLMTDRKEGLMPPAKDPQQLADCILRLLNDHELQNRCGQQGLETAQKYSWKLLARQILQYYEDRLHNSSD